MKKISKWLASINVLDVMKFGMKLLFALRYGYDTVAVSLAAGDMWEIAALNAVVIDAMFTMMWLLAGSKSKREDVQRMRIPAAFGAWAMYIGMLWIAGSIGEGATLVARIGGALFLAFDTYEIFEVALRHFMEQRRAAAEERRLQELRETVEQRRQRARDAAWKFGYGLIVRTYGTWQIVLRSLLRVGKDISTDLEVMDWHDDKARDLRKGQAGMAVAGGADPFEYFKVVERDGLYGWHCDACGGEYVKYRKESMARTGFKAHVRRDTGAPGHQIFRPL